MKLVVFFTLIFCFNIHAHDAFSQKKRVSLKLNNATFKQVIKAIEKQTDLTFLFGNETIRELKSYDLNMKRVKVKRVLNKYLKNSGLTYKIVDSTIIIVPQEKKENAEILVQKKTKEITGFVKDKKGMPLPGVSVVIKGTSKGVSTDIKGRFVINVPDKPDIVLLFSYIGMESQEVKVKTKNDFLIVLKPKKEKLGEVIINGFKSVKKDHFTGNAVVVSKKDILKVNSKSISSALQVFDPSLRMQPKLGFGDDPNSLPEFNLRGESSIAMNKGMDFELNRKDIRNNLKDNPNLPIFLLDDFEVSVQTIYDMDINRIENVTILKDAAATALYGSRAANGVILITTVAPKAGEIRVNYSNTTSIDLPDLDDYNMCNAEEKLRAEVLAGVFKPTSVYNVITKEIEYNQKLQLIQQGVNTDWMAQPLENVYNQKHSMYIEGGTKNSRYGIDINYDDNDGIMKGSFRDRMGVGLNYIYNFKDLIIRNKISYNKTKSENSPYGAFNEYIQMHPYYKIHDENGNLIPNYHEVIYYNNVNPLYKASLESYSERSKIDDIIESLDIDFRFGDGFRFRNTLSLEKQNHYIENFVDPADYSFRTKSLDEKGELKRTYRDYVNINYKSLLNYTKKYNDHFFNAVGGFELTHNKYSYNIIKYQGFQIGNLHSPLYAAQQKYKTEYYEDDSRTVGFLTSVNYSYNDTYLFDGSFRYDGSSKFGANKRFAPFWSVGAGINIHKYEYIQSNFSFLSRLKLRASYGLTGKVNFSSHTAITSFEMNDNEWSQTGSASKLYSLGNEDLKWETTKTTDIGFDMTLFNGKINVRGTYYQKITNDLISDLYLRYSSGFNSYKINSGEIENKGFELQLSAIVARTKDLIVSVNGNMSGNKNKITKLSDAMLEYNKKLNEKYDYPYGDHNKLVTTPFQQFYVGASTTAIYAVKSEGIDPANGQERYIKKNGTPTYTWSGDDQVNVGDTRPDIQGAFGFNVGYKGFFLNSYFLYSAGSQIYNTAIRDRVEMPNVIEDNVDKRFLTERWQKPGDVTPFRNINKYGYLAKDSRPTSRFVQDNDYLEFKTISFGYDFENEMIKKLGISKLGVKINLNDIIRWSTVKTERGYAYPFARSFSLNLNMSF